jgi:hypothetical protein
MSKIAFCFLTYTDLDKPVIWRRYLQNNLDKCNIYIHPKGPLKNDFFKRFVIKNRTKTYKKTDIFIVYATLLTITEALRNPENKKIIFLSQSCFPIVSFDTLYNEIIDNDFSYIKSFQKNKKNRYYSLSNILKSKLNFENFIKQHPNMILDRRDAEYFSKNISLINHFKFMLCPDEHFYINILSMKREDDIKKYGETDISIKDKQICFCNFKLSATQGKEHKIVNYNLIKQLRGMGFFFMRKITKNTFIYNNYKSDILLQK